ncbi:hypothetical protein LZ30DRAFT_781687 [Colletotrichum cereale]|nr:hypothetical protein LZ30DRAFT_781687 [Colletotrichum cereale]
MELESAVLEWLQKERIVPARMPPDFKPSFDLYTSRFPKTIKDAVMAAVIGAPRGFYNVAVFAYWPGTLAYEDWYEKSGFRAWCPPPGKDPQYGWFPEVFFPTAGRFETVFTTAVPEGASHMRESLSGPIRALSLTGEPPIWTVAMACV